MDSAAILTWIPIALIFFAGIVSGMLIAVAWTRFSAANKNRRDLTVARRRILTGIRETHNEEILHEAFRATEDLRSELFKSLHRLRASMNLMLTPAPQPGEKQQPAAAEGSPSTGTEAGSHANPCRSN